MKKIISILLVILWMLFIFNMSSYNSYESSNQSGYIVNIICNIFDIENYHTVSFIIRKLAHFTEYFILGILVYNMCYHCNIKKYIGIIICSLYSISDEVHQLYIPGRSCEIRDILIDITGSILGISFIYILIKYINKRKIHN